MLWCNECKCAREHSYNKWTKKWYCDTCYRQDGARVKRLRHQTTLLDSLKEAMRQDG